MEPLLTIQAAMDRWIQRFAPDWVPEQTGMKRKMEPWRSLQEGGIPCLKGEAARQAFNRVEKKDAVYFRPGADPHDLAAEVFPCTDASVFILLTGHFRGHMYIPATPGLGRILSGFRNGSGIKLHKEKFMRFFVAKGIDKP